jgi:hypothetical protein
MTVAIYRPQCERVFELLEPHHEIKAFLKTHIAFSTDYWQFFENVTGD